MVSTKTGDGAGSRMQDAGEKCATNECGRHDGEARHGNSNDDENSGGDSTWDDNMSTAAVGPIDYN